MPAPARTAPTAAGDRHGSCSRRSVKPAGPVFVVLNARSGRQAIRERVESLRAGFAAAGARAHVFVARSGRQLAGITGAAVAQARRESGILVVAGGDGTINAVGQVALAQEIPFGVIPGGTFNYLSRSHGIPQVPEDAIRAIVEGTVRPVQAGLVNGRAFFVNASIGLYPQLLEDREAYKRRYGRSRMVAAWSALATLFSRSHRLDLELDADGRRTRARTSTLFVGNNRLQLEQVGIAQADCLERGHLVALTAPPLSIGASLRLMVRGFLGRLGDAPEVDSFAFEQLSAISVRQQRRGRIKVATDGEIVSMTWPLIFRPSPHPLRLIVPIQPAAAATARVPSDPCTAPLPVMEAR